MARTMGTAGTLRDIRPSGRDAPLAPSVLVVDDETSFSDTLADILEAKGYRTATANSATEGLKRFGHRRPDIVLLDLKLPDMSGLEVLGHIRELSPTTEVIILTGHATLDTALRAINLGAFGYLEKPYDIDRLFLMLEKALARHLGTPRNAEPQLATLLAESVVPALAYNVASADLVAASPSALRLLNIPDNGELPGLRDLFRDTPTDAFTRHLTDLRTRGSARSDLRLGRSEETARWYELISYRLERQNDVAVAVVVDVTDRRQSELSSGEARRYFEAIFENLASPVVIIDSHLVIQQANPAFARFFRTSPADLIGRRCHEVIHQRQAPCQFLGEICPISSCLATGTTVRSQHRHTDPDEHTHFMEVTVTPLRDDSGTIASFIAVFNDYTEIKTAHEESEKKSRELEQLNSQLLTQREQLSDQATKLSQANTELVRLSAAKDDFVSTVSHELRTPLTAISESINLVADGSLGTMNDAQARFLQVAGRNCVRLSELINDLLDLSKIEAGRLDVHRAQLDLNQVLSDMTETFSVSARDRRLRLNLDATGELTAFADDRLVRRILSNLLSNAVKFTSKGSITVRAEQRRGTVTVTVADTGIGIPAAEVPRMFEKFHQACAQDGTRPPGTGLGLALTKQMVEMNGGKIWFESKEGIGTKFHFTLPCSSDAGDRTNA